MQIFKATTAKSTLSSIYALLLISFVIAALSLGNAILMPLALAILLAFLASPLVTQFEKILGRILAVILVVLLMAAVAGLTVFVLSKELVRFTTELPVYKKNIDARISSLPSYQAIFKSSALDKANINQQPNAPSPTEELFDAKQFTLPLFEWIFGSFVKIMVTTFLVLLLVIFILISRENLRGKFIKLFGQGSIGTTTRALNDASIGVARYLRMMLLINIFYGFAVFAGLYFLGIPNALLWGILSGLLRFVPYIGAWIAALIPIALSLAISTNWLVPFITFGWFLFLETICANIFEPWLYGTSTGVSSIALIIAALFWTILWGPMGLLLSTPLTVCLVVLGRYVPRLEFFSVLLSDEKPFSLYEEFYHSLLAGNIDEVMQLADDYLKEKSLISLYDDVLMPLTINIEKDSRADVIDEEQLNTLQQTLLEMIDDLSTRREATEEAINEELKLRHHTEIIVCLPAKAKRDELVGEMLTQLLKGLAFNAINITAQLKIENVLEFVKKNNPSIIVISVLAPSTIIQARYLARNLRAQFPKIKIIVGLWNFAGDTKEVSTGLQASGTNQVVTSLEEAIILINELTTPLEPR